ncbi:motility associated factor glycosyltransferase family protein [Paenibacillus endoradicis]|uniref:motility associated factor glycosyltransferase family protein n=1 Tax=Paenibacillus endoradicis TaxID=2972487 RepID=UPI002159A3CD|nr:6-hydroxymethylpterin diphosphokinase MptE-like protein [Paenibacillus endoradicis]MCR8660512.1 DUF115 domain-containing protein [Paenibacillus endoradicis]
MSSVLETNLNALRSYREDLYEKIITYMKTYSETNCTIQQAANGTPNLLVHTEGQPLIYAYSKYNPEHECERWAEAIYTEDVAVGDVIMYGLGLTHHLASYITKYPNHQIYLYEPRMDIFIESLKIISLEGLLASPNIRYLAVGESDEELAQLFYWYHTYAVLKKEVVAVPFYLKWDRDKYMNFQKQMEKYLLNYVSFQQYNKHVGKLQHRNILRNIPEVLRTPSLIHYKDKWLGKTAIIVGGGPSLERDIELLKQLENQYIIIAAGTSIQTLLKHGVKPHLTISMDANIYNYNAFSNIDMLDLPLLFIPTIESRIVEKQGYIRIHAFFNHNDEYIHLLNLNENSDPIFIGTHSVTGTAIQAAIYMGVQKIIFTGQDLSYPNMKLYSSGASHLDEHNVEKHKRNMTERVYNVSGGQNVTTLKMKITLMDIEELISKYKDVTFINCSQEGALISGAEYRRLQELDHPSEQYSRDDFIDDYVQNKELYDNELMKRALNKLMNQKEWLSNVILKSSKVNQLLSELAMLSRSKPNKCMNSIAQIEKLWGSIALHSNFALLIEPLIKPELVNFDKVVPYIQKEQRIIAKAKLLSEALSPLITEMNKQIPENIGEIEKSLETISKNKDYGVLYNGEGECNDRERIER